MSLFLCWVVFPLVLSAVAMGGGLLLEHAAGRSVPGALLLPVGLALVIVAAGFATLWDATAELAVPLVVALAVAGVALALPWRPRAIDWWAAGAAGATFGAYAAPIVLSGSATFAGYITLDDTSTWLALTDRVMEHGRHVGGLQPSSYSVVLSDYMLTGYPFGAFLPLGVGHVLVGQDAAWLFQPLIALFAAALALGLYAMLSNLVESRPLRAAIAFVAAQPALLYGYAFWSGIKEFAAAVMIVIAVALLSWTLGERRPARELVPVAVAIAALMTILTVAGAVWLVGAALFALVLAVQRYGRKVATSAVVLAAGVAALALPALVTAGRFFGHVTGNDVLTKGTELGNLVGPLRKLQLLGIWPAGDFRLPADHRVLTYALIGVAIASGLAGAGWAVSRRAWGVVLYLGTVGLGAAILVARGSPWIDGKALATATPGFVLVALLGAAFVYQRGWRIPALALAAAISGGVLWSNVLAYHDVWLAPREQLRELETIGDEFAGEGPTLMTEFQPYGVRHFLRALDPEGAAERRARPIPLRGGELLPDGGYEEIDRFDLTGLLVYRTLVLRRSPVESRPPSAYNLARRGRYYDAWQKVANAREILRHVPLGTEKVANAREILRHVPLGTGYETGAAAPCRQVERLARVAANAGGRVVAATSAPRVAIDLSRATLPRSWQPVGSDPPQVLPANGGTVEATVSMPVGGRYSVWLGGSFRGRLEVDVDGQSVGVQRHRLNWAGQYVELGAVLVAPGVHRVTVRYGGADLHPGSGGAPFAFGPLVLVPAAAPQIVAVSARRARSLCGRHLDWIEAVA